MAAGKQLFAAGPCFGFSVAVVGGGPAGLSCAHALAVLGHAVTIFEARDKLGGLNEYGIAAYKANGDIAQREVDEIWVLAVSRFARASGSVVTFNSATLPAISTPCSWAWGWATPIRWALRDDAAGSADAVDYIAMLRQADDLATVPVGRRVVVVGGGMTAVDAAVQARRLGAEEVTIVYRRGEDAMKASLYERQLCPRPAASFCAHGTGRRRWWAKAGGSSALPASAPPWPPADSPGPARSSPSPPTWCDRHRQVLVPTPSADRDPVARRRQIIVDAEREPASPASRPAGIARPAKDLTVAAVEDGKQLTLAIRWSGRAAGIASAERGATSPTCAPISWHRSPNPFWLASAPPTTRDQRGPGVPAGSGGVVWKTLGEDGPKIVNVSGPRLRRHPGGRPPAARLQQHRADHRSAAGDQPAGVKDVKRARRPGHGRLADGPLPEESWKRSSPASRTPSCDGVELKFGARTEVGARHQVGVGRSPNTSRSSRDGASGTRAAVIVKLTPNITDIRYPARAAHRGGADAVSLINTISSIVSVDLDRMAPRPTIDGKGSHGGYCARR